MVAVDCSLPLYDQSFCLEVDQSSVQSIQRRQRLRLSYLDTSGSLLLSCSDPASPGADQGSLGADATVSGQSSSGPNGGSSASGRAFSRFVLRNGKLLSGSLFYSTSRSMSRQILNEPFTASPNHEDIDTIFSVIDGFLIWSNPAFDGGVARFCIPQSGPFRVVYAGPLPQGCSATNIRVVASMSLLRISDLKANATLVGSASLSSSLTSGSSTSSETLPPSSIQSALSFSQPSQSSSSSASPDTSPTPSLSLTQNTTAAENSPMSSSSLSPQSSPSNSTSSRTGPSTTVSTISTSASSILGSISSIPSSASSSSGRTSSTSSTASSTSADLVRLASSVITSVGLQPFCSSYLGYIPTETTTSVLSLVTNTVVATITAGSETFLTTTTQVETITVASLVEIETTT